MDETAVPALNFSYRAIDMAIVGLYLVVTFGIAVWFGRRQKSTEDFFVGGRRMPWLAVGLSILATLFSTISYLGGPGEMIKHGPGLFVGMLGIPFSLVVVFWLWIPFYMRLGLTSAYEYLERRFNYSTRLIGALLFTLLRIGWMSVVVFATSIAIDGVKGGDWEFLPGPDILWWVGFVGVFSAIYTAVGGIQAMIWIDVLQCILLFAGVFLTIGMVVWVDHSTPWQWWQTAAANSTTHQIPPLFSWDPTVRVTIVTVALGNFFWTICTHGSDQVVLQRYFSTSSMKSARRSYLTNVFVDLTMTVMLSLTGLALLSFYYNHKELLPEGIAADKIFPYFMGHQLPVGVTGLILAAFVCDALQTLESGVNAITAVFCTDILPRFKPEEKLVKSTSGENLTIARIISLVVTLAVSGIAFSVVYMSEQDPNANIVTIMPRFFNLFSGPLAGLFFIGMFLPRCTHRTAIPALCLGLFVAFVWAWWPQIFSLSIWPTMLGEDYWKSIYNKDKIPTPYLTIFLASMTTFLSAGIAGAIFERGSPQGREWNWWAVIRRARDQARLSQSAE